MSAEHRYGPGGWSAVLQSGAALLVDPSLPVDRLLAVWDLLRDGAAVEQVLDVLTERGLGAMPGFALVATQAAGLRVVTRRPAAVELVGSDGSVRRVEGAASTWLDELHPPAVQARLLGSGGSGPDCPLPCVAGVLAAEAICWLPGAVPAPAPAQRSVPSPALPERSVHDRSVPAVVTPAASLPVMPDPEATLGLPDTLTERPSREPEVLDLAQSMGFDALFGATRAMSVELAAVRDQEDLDLDRNPAAGTGSGLIDAVPWAAPPVGPPGVPAAAPSGAPADGDRTVTMAELVRLGVLPASRVPFGSGMPAAPADPGPRGALVLAIRCPAGHPNPPQSDRCRNCEAPVEYRDPETVVRPTLGVLRFSTGQVVPLDQPVLVGRAPTVERSPGTELPVPVRIQDRGEDLSRNHVEIRIEGWQAFAVDLNSRNGTVVMVPGRKPQALDPLAPFPLPPGARVALSDQVSFSYEVNR